MVPRGGGIYVAIARDFPFFKVGSTRDMRTREMGLRWVMPGGMAVRNFWRLETYSSFHRRAVEIDVQARLEQWACAGEWFHATPEALAMIDGWGKRLPKAIKPPVELRNRWKWLRMWLADRYARGAA